MMLSVDDSLIVLSSDFLWVWKAIDFYLRRKLSEVQVFGRYMMIICTGWSLGMTVTNLVFA